MWTSIEINRNQIETETEKAILIKLPKNSNLNGFVFWHPSKLVRNGKGRMLTFSFNEDFVFKIFKNGKGKTNKFKKIDEIIINAEEMENEWI